jgi:hypothetical protein
MRRLGLVLAFVIGVAASASAQIVPDRPISVANGRVVLGGEVTATIAPDDPGFFNYTNYEYSALRNFRLGVSAEIKASERLQVLGEVRLDHGDVLEAYGLYVRIRPWPSRRFDIQAGRIPPTFGALSRTAYGESNILIGQPLAYQYLTSIRADAVPATTSDLLRMRGRGWLSNFPVGNTLPGPGLPIINTSRWDTGVQAHGVAGIFEMTGSISAGSLSDPRFHDNNAGRQIAGRLVTRPVVSTALGLSVSRGAWLNGALEDALAHGADYERSNQAAIGADAEFSRGPFLVRGEVIRSAWSMPKIATLQLPEPIRAVSTLIEGRYKIAPGLYLAMRGDRLYFNTITGDRGRRAWDAAIWRIETGAGYSITRNIMVKGVFQKNNRDGGLVRHDSFFAGQVTYWF